MINVDGLDDEVLNSIARDRGWDADYDDEDITPYLKPIEQLSVEQSFEHYCSYRGLIGDIAQLIEALDNIRASEIKECE